MYLYILLIFVVIYLDINYWFALFTCFVKNARFALIFKTSYCRHGCDYDKHYCRWQTCCCGHTWWLPIDAPARTCSKRVSRSIWHSCPSNFWYTRYYIACVMFQTFSMQYYDVLHLIYSEQDLMITKLIWLYWICYVTVSNMLSRTSPLNWIIF